MSTPPTAELATLHGIADELREEFDARGHRIGTAMERDAAFDRGYVESALGRSLIESAVLQAAMRRGVQRPDLPGGGFELQFVEGFHDRRYRIRQAKRLRDGTLKVPTSSDSGLAPADGYPWEPQLIEIDQWVLAVVRHRTGTIAEVVIAKVVGKTEGRPGRLLFGEEFLLGGPGDRPTIGFTPSDEDLPGFEEDEDEDENDGYGHGDAGS